MRLLKLTEEEHAWLSENIKRLLRASHGAQGFRATLEKLKEKMLDKEMQVVYAEARTIERLCEESIEGTKARIKLYKSRLAKGNEKSQKYIDSNEELKTMLQTLKRKATKCT